MAVTRSPRHLYADPFARLVAATLVPTGLFATVPPLGGSVMERYGGEPWPAEGF